MPNICSTEIYFDGNAVDVRGLHRMLVSFTSKSLAEIKKSLKVDAEAGRGELVYVGDVENLGNKKAGFVVSVDTAWSPDVRIFRQLAADFGGLGFAWYGVELGCGVFEANNAGVDHFGAEFFVSNFAGDYEGEPLADKLSAVAEGLYTDSTLNTALSSALGHGGETQALVDEIMESGGDEFFSVYSVSVA